MDTKAQIQELISLGKTEEALELLEQLTTDSVLLQSRYNGAKRQYSMGMIDYSEWSRTQAQINYAALEMMNSVRPPKGGGPEVKQENVDTKTILSHRAFISYNHNDREVVDKIEAFLEGKGLNVIRDTQDMIAGETIESFIQRVMREKGHILSVVSANSMSSGWVGVENDLSFYSSLFGGLQFIPVMVSPEVMNSDFIYKVVESIDEKLKGLEAEVKKRKKLRLSDDDLIPKRKRLENLRQDLPKIIHRLQKVLTIDISGENFNSGLEKVVAAIKK